MASSLSMTTPPPSPPLDDHLMVVDHPKNSSNNHFILNNDSTTTLNCNLDAASSPSPSPSTTDNKAQLPLPHPHPEDLAHLVSLLHTELADKGIHEMKHQMEIDRIRSIMESYVSNCHDWLQYAHFDKSKRKYTRNLVDDGNGKFNLMVLCWPEGQSSAIHDHAGSHCLMKVLDGEITETQYHWPEPPSPTEDGSSSCCPMKVKQATVYSENGVAYIHDKIGLHRVSNPSSNRGAISLHLYCPPYDACKTFCESTSTARGSGKCLFFSERGKIVNHISSALTDYSSTASSETRCGSTTAGAAGLMGPQSMVVLSTLPSEVLVMILKEVEDWSLTAALEAINEGIRHVDVLRYLDEKGMKIPSVEAVDEAILCGRLDVHLEIIQVLHEYGYEHFTKKTMDSAAQAGRLDIIQYLHTHRSEGCSTDAMDMAAEGGHMEVVLFLHFNRTEGCATKAMDSAAREGHLEILNFLNDHRAEGCSTDAMDWAAEAGFLDIVSNLHHHRSEGCTARAMDRAAECGHLDVVKFLYRHREEVCMTDAMDLAAAEGYLDIVKYLNSNREEGCTTAAMDLAAEGGHLDVVKFLCFNRTERWTEAAISKAAGMGYFAVVKFLQEVVQAVSTPDAVIDAATNGYFEIAIHLYAF
ncbi:hypothetical protein HDU97_001554 [Phlyctochytrium planicorne]|nr:hypothetical protein HDU97_001554 [Phlyctochytrium planicorne]